MILPQTDFRPQIHGFDFENSWDQDDNYRDFIREKLKDSLPIVVQIMVENPALGAALLASMGAVVAVGEALTGGLFETVIIPATINQIVDGVKTKIKDFIPDHYGACGGMAFASLDYYYNKWIIPKGVNDRTIEGRKFDVPPKDNGIDQTLRNYIYDRLIDTYDDGGVQHKTLEWYIILKTLPPGVGGGPVIQTRTKAEWAKITGLLDQHKPQPIAIMFDVDDIFDNHQVVAYGYGGDPFTGNAFINIYDNNHPNIELVILFTFVNNQMDGVITNVVHLQFDDQDFTVIDKDGNIVTDFKKIQYGKTKIVKGFFLTTYTMKTPPVGWGIESALTVSPSTIQSEGEYFEVSGQATNAFTFFEKEPDLNPTRFIPIVEQGVHLLQVTGLGSLGKKPKKYIAFKSENPSFTGNKKFDTQGDYRLYAKAQVFVENAILKGDGTIQYDGAIKNDNFGIPLMRILFLPAHPPEENFVSLKVLARLNIIPYNKDGLSCFQPYVEGQDVTLIVDKNPFPNDNVEYRWTIAGQKGGKETGEKLVLHNLKPAPAKYDVSVRLKNKNTGAIANGDLSFFTYSSQDAQQQQTICEATHIITYIVAPGLIHPLGPDDPDFRKYLLKNAREIGIKANQLFHLTKKIEEFREI